MGHLAVSHRSKIASRRGGAAPAPPLLLGTTALGVRNREAPLEVELAPDLPPPRQTLGVHLPKVALRQIVLDGKEIGVIEHVVELEPELEIEPLRYVRVLVKRQIRLYEGRIAELTRFFVSVRAGNRHAELPSRKDSGGMRGPGSGLMITCDIRMTEVVTVGEIVPGTSGVSVGTHDVVCAIVSSGRDDRKRITSLVNTGAA